MASHRFSVFFGVASVFLGLKTAPVHAQAPPEVASETARQMQGSPLAEQKDDAAAEALRSLYVPGGLTSTQAVTQIAATSPDLDRAKTLLLDAKGGAMQAMSALVPRLELLGRYSRLSPVDNSTTFEGEFDIPGLGVGTFSIPVDFPALTQQIASDATLIYSFTNSLAEALPAYRAAKKNKISAAYQIEAERNNVAFAARQAYYEFARAEAGLGVANFALEAAVSQRKETEALVEAGSAARVDLMRVQAQEEAAKVAVERAKFGLQVATRSLQALMHTEELPTLGEDLSEPVGGVPTEPESALKERAFRERPDLRALRAYVEASKHQLRSAIGGKLPDLLIRGSAQYSNPNLRVFPQQERFAATWEAGAVIRWAPNDTVRAQGRSKQLQAELERAHADVDQLEIAIRVEVAEGYHGMLAARSAMDSARLGLSAAREGYRVTREQLQAGIVNTTTLLQAQSELIRAQVDVVESAIGLRIAKATLLRAIGETP
ncbi:MAG: TolC family protein [Myxococcales bacterium]|nr:TolC family protein [Myxococcales bacterium]